MGYGEQEQQQEQEQQLIATGSYLAELIGWEYGFTKNNHAQLALQFRLLDGPDQGRTIPAYRNFADGAIEYTFEAMTALGWDGESVDNPEGLGTKQVMLVINHEEYNGKWNAKVQYINSLARLNSKPMTQQDRSKFGVDMKGALLKYQREKLGKGAPAAASRPNGNGAKPAANGGARAAAAPKNPPPRNPPPQTKTFAHEGWLYYEGTNEPVLDRNGQHVQAGPQDDDIPF